MTATATASALATNSWCGGGSESFNTSFRRPDATPGGMVAWALDYVYPLPDWFDGLLGDEADVHGFAHEWDQASRELQRTQVDVEHAMRTIEAMQGKSVRALRRATETVTATATDAAEWTEATAAALNLAAEVVVAVREAVVGSLSEIADFVGAVFGRGPLEWNPVRGWQDLFSLIDLVDGFVDIVSNLIDRMFAAFDQLQRLIEALEPLIEQARIEIRDLLARMIETAGGPLGFIGGSIFGPAGALVGAIMGDTLGGAASAVISSTPSVTEVDVNDLVSAKTGELSRSQAAALERSLDVKEFTSLGDFVDANGLSDSMGESDRTVVDIRLVRNAAGEEHWVVSLPSTQDWNILKSTMGEDAWADILKDYPATNDLDTNVALMLANNPEIATQYQRGVYEAMRQAGVPEGAPVVYTGFSQGGIMAANLASHESGPYSTIGIVATGSPIDNFNIPDSVAVAAFGHESDIVPALDGDARSVGKLVTGLGIISGQPGTIAAGTLLKGADGNIATVELEDPEVHSNHSIKGYSQSVREWEQDNPAAAREFMDLMGGEVVDHQIYQFQE